jgi:hypothetical protein
MCTDIDRALVSNVFLVDPAFLPDPAFFADLPLFAIDLSSSPSLLLRAR